MIKSFPTNPLYRVPSFWVGYIKGLVTGMTVVILAIALNWSIKNWKAIEVVMNNPEAVAELKFETQFEVKK